MKNGIRVAVACIWMGWSGYAQSQTTFTNVLIRGWLKQSTNSYVGGTNSTAFGYSSKAYSNYSLAEGLATVASNIAAHAEGAYTLAFGSYSHAEGYSNTAYGVASHAEGRETDAGGNCSHAEGFATEAAATNSHAGGEYAMVQSNHAGAFIHAAGTAEAMKLTQFPNTAHFDRLVTLEAAQNASNAVLARYENDLRYATIGQGALASTALQPNTVITVATVCVTSGMGINTNASGSNALAVAGDMQIFGRGTFSGGILVPQQGDISMGAYTHGSF